MLRQIHPGQFATAVALLANKRFRYNNRLEDERRAFRTANHVIGRTLWDEAHAYALNPDATYHKVGEILREAFYSTRWNLDNCEKHSIFVGNSASPRKGAHIALQALALVAKDYSDMVVYIAGEDPARFPRSSYRHYMGYPFLVRQLIAKLGLQRRVVFTGLLNEQAMSERMAQCHVFLLPSLIENSPNTLGEAMLMGVPSVAAYAGGTPSMAEDEKEVLFYRAEDAVMLAHQVRRVFSDSNLAQRLSGSAMIRAAATHDPERIVSDLMAIYEQILVSVVPELWPESGRSLR